jgi:Eukaryotic aspartyl protease
VTFAINGHQYNVTSAVLTMDIGLGGNRCLFGIYPIDLSALVSSDDSDFKVDFSWILGDPFIRAYCHVHDVGNRRLGLAMPICSG